MAANEPKNLDVDLTKIRMEVEAIVPSGRDRVTAKKLPQKPPAKKVIEFAMEEARKLNHSYVGTEHILLGLLREEEGRGAQVLCNLGLKLEEVRQEVLNLLGYGIELDDGQVRRTAGGNHEGFERITTAFTIGQRVRQFWPQLAMLGAAIALGAWLWLWP